MSSAAGKVGRALAVVVALGAIAAGCGGGGQSLMDSVSSEGTAASVAADNAQVSIRWAHDAVVIAKFCVDQLTDGTGNLVAADRAVTDVIAIARSSPDVEYQNGATYRQALGDVTSIMSQCDAQFTGKLDRASSTLPAP